MSVETSNLNNDSPPKFCAFFMARKGRNCRMTPLPGKIYCVNHISLCDQDTQNLPKRVLCPVDPTHFVLESEIESHIKKCPKYLAQLKVKTKPFFQEGVNAGSDDEPDLTSTWILKGDPNKSESPVTKEAVESGVGASVPERRSSRAAMRATLVEKLGETWLLNFIEKIERIYAELGLTTGGAADPPLRYERPADVVTALKPSDRQPFQIKHARQHVSFVGNMRRFALLPSPPAPLDPAVTGSTAETSRREDGEIVKGRSEEDGEKEGGGASKRVTGGPLTVVEMGAGKAYLGFVIAQYGGAASGGSCSVGGAIDGVSGLNNGASGKPGGVGDEKGADNQCSSTSEGTEEISRSDSSVVPSLVDGGGRGCGVDGDVGDGAVLGLVVSDWNASFKNKADRYLRHLPVFQRIAIDLKDFDPRRLHALATPPALPASLSLSPSSASLRNPLRSSGTNENSALKAPDSVSNSTDTKDSASEAKCGRSGTLGGCSKAVALTATPSNSCSTSSVGFRRRPTPGWVGVGKHLCGAATDYMLRACFPPLLEDGLSSAAADGGEEVESSVGGEAEASGRTARFRGLAVSPCCHHRCSWRAYVGKELMRRCGIAPVEFEVMSWMTGWALCRHGAQTKTKRRRTTTLGNEEGRQNDGAEDDDEEDDDDECDENDDDDNNDDDDDDEEEEEQQGKEKKEEVSYNAGIRHNGKCAEAMESGETTSAKQQRNKEKQKEEEEKKKKKDDEEVDAMAKGDEEQIDGSDGKDADVVDEQAQRRKKAKRSGDQGLAAMGQWKPSLTVPLARRTNIGMKCKLILDLGRLRWIQARADVEAAEFVRYVPPEVSGENRLLLARA